MMSNKFQSIHITMTIPDDETTNTVIFVQIPLILHVHGFWCNVRKYYKYLKSFVVLEQIDYP